MTKYVVYGLGISGVSAIKFLAKNNEEVIATDDNQEAIKKIKSELEISDFAIGKKIKFQNPDEVEYDANTIVSFAPGIPLYFPKRHKILEITKKTGAQLVCDLEIFYQKNRQDNFIAITGTNGKSTTTALSGFVLSELGIEVKVGGNIGVPCFDLPASPSPPSVARVGEGWGEGKISGEGLNDLSHFKKNLRKNQTEAEKKLWNILKNRQINNSKFRRQEQIENYIVDFVCFDKKLIIELDGGQHGEEKNIAKDQERTGVLEKKGFRVLRFWNGEIFQNIDGVVDLIFNELNSPHQTFITPHPNPLPQGEREPIEIPLPQGEREWRTTYVFETSSYQLDLLSQSHFKIAALLNITPDHLDRHGSIENYIAAKKRIFNNQTAEDFALIDVDNENSKKVFDELKNDKNFTAKLIPISTLQIQTGGVALIDGILFNKINGADEKLELKSEFLRGKHNDQNMAFAFTIAYCHLSPTKTSEIISAIKKFRGLRHRMQILGEISGIRFINDSKATNAESTEHALKAYKNIFWILGGRAKAGGIETLQPLFKKIVKAYLIGEASEEFAKTLEKNSVIFEKCGDLKTAFHKSFADAKNNSLSEKNILLSPASASLDQWKNFEQRGDFFCKSFDELPKI